jgi:hypothetical protein
MMHLAGKTALALAILAGPAMAGSIHQCRTTAGAIVFQDWPCAAGQQTVSMRPIEDAGPSPAGTAADRAERRRIEAWDRASRERLAPSLGGREPPAGRAPPSRSPPGRGAPDACQQARQVREAAYRRDGNRMDFDRRRALQDAVTAACGLR